MHGAGAERACAAAARASSLLAAAIAPSYSARRALSDSVWYACAISWNRAPAAALEGPWRARVGW